MTREKNDFVEKGGRGKKREKFSSVSETELWGEKRGWSGNLRICRIEAVSLHWKLRRWGGGLVWGWGRKYPKGMMGKSL